jgi:hypothetical protein
VLCLLGNCNGFCYFIHLTCSSRALFASFATGMRKPSVHPSSFRRFSICLTIIINTKLLYPAIKATYYAYYGVFTYTYCRHGNMTSSLSCNSRETEGMKRYEAIHSYFHRDCYVYLTLHTYVVLRNILKNTHSYCVTRNLVSLHCHLHKQVLLGVRMLCAF